MFTCLRVTFLYMLITILQGQTSCPTHTVHVNIAKKKQVKSTHPQDRPQQYHSHNMTIMNNAHTHVTAPAHTLRQPTHASAGFVHPAAFRRFPAACKSRHTGSEDLLLQPLISCNYIWKSCQFPLSSSRNWVNILLTWGNDFHTPREVA